MAILPEGVAIKPAPDDKVTAAQRAQLHIVESSTFDLRTLAHPVGRITIDACAAAAGVSASTVSAQAGSTERFRQLLHLRLIDQLDVRPGKATWSALHESLHAGAAPVVALSAVCVARMDELAADPALPFVLGAFNNAEIPKLTDNLNTIHHMIGLELAPLMVAALAANGIDLRPVLSLDASLRLIASAVLTGAFRNLVSEIPRLWTVQTDDGPADLLVAALARQLGILPLHESASA